MQSYSRQQKNRHEIGSKAMNLRAFLFYSIRLFFLQKKCRQVMAPSEIEKGDRKKGFLQN